MQKKATSDGKSMWHGIFITNTRIFYHMSYELQCLALKQKDLTLTQFTTLFYLAFRANEQNECWPSIKGMSTETHMDRKSIIEAIKFLIQKKLIIKTGEMKGKTKRVPVYKLILNNTENGTIKEGKWFRFSHKTVPKTELLNSTKNGTRNIYIQYTKECGTNYQEYVSKFNADVKLGLKSKDEKPLNFTEWKEIDML